MKLFESIKSLFKPPKPIGTPIGSFEFEPDSCKHKRWSPDYDYSDPGGGVSIVNSYCLDCGPPQKGSGQ